MEKFRLDRIISESGLASRREAAQLIKSGFVTVDGRPASSADEKVDPVSANIAVKGVPLEYRKFRYYMMNKPQGVVSATEDAREKTVLDLLGEVERRLGLCPAGRLDKDAEGLLILTNDGDWAHRVISPSKHVYKTYEIRTEGALTTADEAEFERGIVLGDGLECLPGTLEIISSGSESRALVRIREGKYHQVKRMLAVLGKPVTSLKRIAIGALCLDASLAPGAYRPMTEEETQEVFKDYGNNVLE